MDLKLIWGIAASVLAVIVFIPYFRDIFRKTTQPHLYSWLGWGLLQIVGTAAAWKANAGYGTLSLAIGAAFCLSIAGLSLKYGTKNIKRVDLYCLIGVCAALVLYAAVENPLYSVIIVSIMDFFAFLPTFRKGFEEPRTETASTYFMSALSNALSIFATRQYSATTILYGASLFITNGSFFLMIMVRRKIIARKQSELPPSRA